MKLKVSLVVVAMMALASIGSAQQGGGRRQGGRGQQGVQRLTQLLRNPQVQEELKVTDDEKAKIEELPRPQRAQGGGGGGGYTPPTSEELTKQFAEDKAATSAILTPDQEKRLEELRIQWGGPSAVFAPDVQASLGLTEDQKTKLATLQTQQRTATRSAMQDAAGDREAMAATMTKMQETMKTEVEKVLTDDQKAKLKALGGAELRQVRQQRPGGAAF